jgi:hypothetical protein
MPLKEIVLYDIRDGRSQSRPRRAVGQPGLNQQKPLGYRYGRATSL